MVVRHIELTASGPVGVSGARTYVVGWNMTGFTAVKLHDGTDTSGPVVMSATAAGMQAVNYEVDFANGCYAELTGTGTISVWVA